MNWKEKEKKKQKIGSLACILIYHLVMWRVAIKILKSELYNAWMIGLVKKKKEILNT